MTSMQIDPVGQCRGARPPAFMSFDAFCRALDQCVGIEHLQLQGMGEPFLHPLFLDMVRHAVDRGIEVTAKSNLTALSPRRAEELVASGLARLHVCFDASKRHRVLRNLALVQQAKKRLRSARPEITLVALAWRRNPDELPRLVCLAAEYGVRSMSVDDQETPRDEDPARLERVLDQARAVAHELEVELWLPAEPGLRGLQRPLLIGADDLGH